MGTRWHWVALFVVLAAVSAAGCSYSISTQQQESPPAEATTIVVGEVRADDDDHQREVRRFRRQLIAALDSTGAFERVIAPAPATLPAGAVVVTGHIHRIGDGSEPLRFLLGSGAGAPRLRVRLQIHDATGVRLAAFAQSARSYSGTGFSGHFNPVYLDDLVDDLADRSAYSIVRWQDGRPIDAMFWDDWFAAAP